MAYKILFFLFILKRCYFLKELGEYLKETRENNCVGIEEASEDLNVSVNILENIENGNTRAFRDMYDLKEKVKEYAKYLGLNPEEVIDEFNDFFFEHTSKISLSDILEAENESRSKDTNKVISPYTQQKKVKINLKYLKIGGIIIGSILLVVSLLLILLYIILPKEEVVKRELYTKYDVEVIK